ncbi:MAG: hypothetical protein J3K34DRAFT_380636, partial [Monoraphidium minutum]
MPQAPLPLETLARVWGGGAAGGGGGGGGAEEAAYVFEMQGVVKLATLKDGSVWVMASPEHLAHVCAAHADALPELHAGVLAAFEGGGGGGARVHPLDFQNDGYIMLAVAHHLVGAGRLDDLRALLTSPAWLEAKLHLYGVAPVVDDFRKYLQAAEDPLVKLVLQAFQMSVPTCMQRPALPIMRRQLVLRTMAAAAAGPHAEWFAREAFG